jgi:outer membrane immunogenic protein
MRKLLLATTLLATPGYAADLQPKVQPLPYASYSWSGLYLDGFGLYGANFTGTDVTDGTTLAQLAAVPHGPGLGGDLMYLTQLSPFVLGIRASIAYASLSGSGQINSAALSVSNATNYLGDLNAILGLPLSSDGRLLGYITGGFAFGGAKPNLQFGTLAVAASDTSTGWDIGAGLRYALTPNWSVGIEGLYYKLGDKQLTITDPSSGLPILTSTAKYDIAVQKIVVGYKF